jgi:hypothetical protein
MPIALYFFRDDRSQQQQESEMKQFLVISLLAMLAGILALSG